MKTRLLALVGLVLLGAGKAPVRELHSVTAVLETDPVPYYGDAADDSAIWVDPHAPERSVVIGTDKKGGLITYDLSGKRMDFYPDGRMNNVDLRNDFTLGGNKVTLVVASNRSTDSLAVYTLDSETRRLQEVAAKTLSARSSIYGICLYQSHRSGNLYAFVPAKDGSVEQFELRDNGSGKVIHKKVRTLMLSSIVEGCVADDEYGTVFVGEENVGIWKFGAEPNDSTKGVSIDQVGKGHLEKDVEGLAIYHEPGGEGYLIASSQGNNTYVIYRRNGNHEHVKTFEIVKGRTDQVTDTDGIEVTSANLGSVFPRGLFIAQDGSNSGMGEMTQQNFKYVSWDDILPE